MLSPDDDTDRKFGFYAAHEVDEIVVADPATQSVQCFRRAGEDYAEGDGSALLGVTAQWLTEAIRWP